MVIEWLEFKVDPESREKFIQKDNEVWTALLVTYPGFIGKEIWLDPTALDQVTMVIRWQTRQQWKSVPQEILEETERKFARAMGVTPYEMIETREYQIRKFPEVAR
ncbi:TIGR03792 family protein [Pleurocapsales cyanobacterium LEGE 06147]|nr:TIGR03792 family protein [Pleurocapsales cyanobacterium LEGE 06147]